MSKAGERLIAAATEAPAVARGEAGPVVLVCGGRDFADQRLLVRTLEGVLKGPGIGVLVQGGARGADTLAANWGRMRGLAVVTVMADWEREGRAAGPIRNQRMLDEHHPDLVIAFPGGKGTADMVRRARAGGYKVTEIPAD